MAERLGTLTLTVTLVDDGSIDVHHRTALSPALDLMLSGLSGAEREQAAALRREAGARAAQFFMLLRNPDRPVRVV